MPCSECQEHRCTASAPVRLMERSMLDLMPKITVRRLRCESPVGHQGEHRVHMPADAGDDLAGKLWIFNDDQAKAET